MSTLSMLLLVLLGTPPDAAPPRRDKASVRRATPTPSKAKQPTPAPRARADAGPAQRPPARKSPPAPRADNTKQPPARPGSTKNKKTRTVSDEVAQAAKDAQKQAKAKRAPKAPAAKGATKAAPAAKGATKAAPAAKGATKAAPAVRRATKAAPAARRAEPKTAKEGTKAAKATSKPSKTEKAEAVVLPVVRDGSVKVKALSNGILSWCASRKHWGMLELSIAIKAGSSTDQYGLPGRARFLAFFLEKRLNQPKNPAVSRLPLGKSRFHVTLRKDWLLVQVRLRAADLQEGLKHLAASIRQGPPEQIGQRTRERMIRSAGDFPPPRLHERIDAILFDGDARGAFLQGTRRTFKLIQPFALQSAHRRLYAPKRIRILAVSGMPCKRVQTMLEAAFVPAKTSQGDVLKAAKPIGPQTPSSRASSRGFFSSRRNLFLSQELVSLYRLPAIQRKDLAPLRLVHYVASQELQRAMRRRFGRRVPLSSKLQLYPKSGYILFVMPSRPANRRELRSLSRDAIGQLLMYPYPPGLEARLRLYREELLLSDLQSKESTKSSAALLLPQILLPSEVSYPLASAPALQAISSGTFRKLARRFLIDSPAFARTPRSFSFRRIAMFVGSLLLLWFFLDLLIRRTRHFDD